MSEKLLLTDVPMEDGKSPCALLFFFPVPPWMPMELKQVDTSGSLDREVSVSKPVRGSPLGKQCLRPRRSREPWLRADALVALCGVRVSGCSCLCVPCVRGNTVTVLVARDRKSNGLWASVVPQKGACGVSAVVFAWHQQVWLPPQMYDPHRWGTSNAWLDEQSQRKASFRDSSGTYSVGWQWQWHSENSVQQSLEAWPYRREQRGRDPAKKKSVKADVACSVGKVCTYTLLMTVCSTSNIRENTKG